MDVLPGIPGVLTGLILGLTGSGGSIIAVPLLLFGLNVPVAEAAPVALLSVGVSAAIATYSSFRQKIVRYRAAGFIAGVGMLITPAGIWVAQQLSDSWLTILFSVVLTYAAMSMYRKSNQLVVPSEKAIFPPCQLSLESGRLIWTIPCVKGLLASGALTGFLSGLLGVGGGFIIIPALRKVSDLPMKTLIATALSITALISLTGVISAISMGFMNWSLALPFAIGTVVGMLIGKHYARNFNEVKLQRGFAILSWCIALSMLIKAVMFLVYQPASNDVDLL